MFEKLVEIIAKTTEDRANDISLEDVALGRTWCDVRRYATNEPELRQAALERIDVWLRRYTRPPCDTEGRRSQWLLRDLIDCVRAGDVSALERDELDFLSAAFHLAKRMEDREGCARVRTLLTPYVNEIEIRRKILPSANGLAALSKRLHVVDTADIETAPYSAIRTIAGIVLPARGPLLKLSGHVKLFGSVQDNCTLVVENGCCSVLGYVLGRLAVTQHCDVRHNISGVAISSLGGIRARNIIDQAGVIAKAGNVQVRRVENPKLLFAGERLVVTDSIRRGNIIAPDISVQNEVLGGHLQVSRSLRADCFRATPELPLDITFRKRLASSDFGGTPTAYATRLWSQTLHLKTRILTLEALLAATDREIERLSENALFFVCSNDASEKHVDSIRKNKRRLDLIDRIIEGLLGMAYAIAERAAERALALQESGEAGLDEAGVMFRVADALLTQLGSDADGERDVYACINSMADIRENLRRGVHGNRLATTSLTRIREELRRWLDEKQRLAEYIAAADAGLHARLDFSEILQSAAEGSTPEQRLRHLLAIAQNQPPGGELAAKLASSFVSAMLRSIDKKHLATEPLRRELSQKRGEFDKKSRQLRTQHHLVVPLEETDHGEGPRVSGRFEGGVVLYADALAAGQEQPPDATRFVVPDTGEAVKTYQRRFISIVETCP